MKSLNVKTLYKDIFNFQKLHNLIYLLICMFFGCLFFLFFSFDTMAKETTDYYMLKGEIKDVPIDFIRAIIFTSQLMLRFLNLQTQER